MTRIMPALVVSALVLLGFSSTEVTLTESAGDTCLLQERLRAGGRGLQVSGEQLAQLQAKYGGMAFSENLALADPRVTSAHLADLENKYGGYVTGVVRHVKADDERTEGSGYMHHSGGDRMSKRHNNYGAVYADFINRLLLQGSGTNLNVVEVGILKGSGLAMWSEVFKGSAIFGFDLDPSNYESNLPKLIEKGFNPATTKVSVLDQTEVDYAKLKADLGDRRISMLVDDGCHSKPCARNTFKAFVPHMADRFVYFVEDGAFGHDLEKVIEQDFPQMRMEKHGRLTVIFRL